MRGLHRPVDGQAVKRCSDARGPGRRLEVTTIEGLTGRRAASRPGGFWEQHGLQCGFCTPGMIMIAADLLTRERRTRPRTAIRHAIEGNICRCTGYHNIVKAVTGGQRPPSAPARRPERRAR